MSTDTFCELTAPAAAVADGAARPGEPTADGCREPAGIARRRTYVKLGAGAASAELAIVSAVEPHWGTRSQPENSAATSSRLATTVDASQQRSHPRQARSVAASRRHRPIIPPAAAVMSVAACRVFERLHGSPLSS